MTHFGLINMAPSVFSIPSFIQFATLWKGGDRESVLRYPTLNFPSMAFSKTDRH